MTVYEKAEKWARRKYGTEGMCRYFTVYSIILAYKAGFIAGRLQGRKEK